MATGIQISPPSGITIGTTSIDSGVDGRVLFQAGGVVQQDAALFWDNTNKILTLGTTGINGELQINRSTGGTNIGGVRANSAGSGAEIGGANNYTNKILLHNTQGIHFFTGTNTSDSTEKMRITTGTSWGVGIGTTSPQARLDVRAQGALSTDIAFRVRNSVDSANILTIAGNSDINTLSQKIYQNADGAEPKLIQRGSLSWFEIISTRYNNASENLKASTTLGKIAFSGDTAQNKLNFVNSVSYWGTSGIYSAGFHWYKSTVSGDPSVTGIASSTTNANRQMWLTPDNSLLLFNTGGINYATNTDSFQLYSADIVAGNAAPHFRTENGSVVKLYRQDLPTNPTTAEIATFLSNLGLANLV